MMTVDNLHQRQLEEAARLLEAKDYRAAHAVCIEVLTADPANSEAYHLLGILTAEHGNHQKACEIFDRALAEEPARADTLAHKARSLIPCKGMASDVCSITLCKLFSHRLASTCVR